VKRTAIIIGAGPAGLTAAYELARRTDITPIILEQDDAIGGISRTGEYKGNRIDFGGHRFFTKSDRVLDWWLAMFPLEAQPGKPGPNPDETDNVMLVRKRISRIYYLRKFFNYPVSLSAETLGNLGFTKSMRIGLSYLHSVLFPIREVENIEQLMINRFGRELYDTFFKSYTEKVWGVPPHQISADWGVQRIKDLSVSRAVLHYLREQLFPTSDIRQKSTSTSLIEQFMYPKFGPGQMWEETARRVVELGGELRRGQCVTGLHMEGRRVAGVEVRDGATGALSRLTGDFYFSTMPVKELVAAVDTGPSEEVRRIASQLQYRDFMTIGLLLSELKIGNGGAIPDTWFYIQESDVKVGRLQVYNNWSQYMVRDPRNTVWTGLDYYCNEGDPLWRMPDPEMLQFAIDEVDRIGLVDRRAVLDGAVLRMKKTYPAYIGAYSEFATVRAWLDSIENLFCIGRNGMHHYNNQDHSMLTAMTAVDNILAGVPYRDNLWAVNTEQEYHETK